ncbi:CPBP family intramembrane glutamic endopeptidase [Marinactinospora rubrisoli]|uniref:CPBP family intramembrane glutamic endopeptidase n=1 Tax=Marinactinospora rubrisoli TaxID=2715399 RepID=A0ABW2K979_9ACTN
MLQRRGLWVGIAVYGAALAVTVLTYPVLGAWERGEPSVLWETWVPITVGLFLTWLATLRTPRRELERRLDDVLEGHPLGRELGWLLGALLAFLIGEQAMAFVFGQIHPDYFGLAVPVARLLFLFVVPVLLVDRAGFSMEGSTTGMPRLAMGVTEPWRWTGLIPVLGCLLALVIGMGEPLTPVPDGVAFGVFVALVVISVPEEIFFRGMVQTRLERLTGRWSGIVLTSLLFAATYAVLGGYAELPRSMPYGGQHDLGLSIATYGVSGLLYGYVWACYRNMWLNILLRGGVITLVVAPSLQIIG